ncbi:MAG: nucleotidyltransferase domain-containing protein [Candidatus Methanoperedens sp.]|nr:nucleotidyltransferase domain-containing protein [Candidatus Methanoperedens sp.]MCZ7394561.1 nucleotidyltransferase domain-containing protein [Candidatus Methanoperedens sp.]
MIQLYQKITQLKVLELFIKNPYERYYLREASRILDISPMTVKRAIDLLVQDRLLVREEFKNQILYKANMASPAFKHLKTAYNLAWLEEKGIVEFLKERLPGLSSLVLYGSFAKGENDETSDIDLLAISLSAEKLDLRLSELLGKETSLIIFTPSEWKEQAEKNKAFYIDVITEGIVLFGTRPVVE